MKITNVRLIILVCLLCILAKISLVTWQFYWFWHIYYFLRSTWRDNPPSRSAKRDSHWRQQSFELVHLSTDSNDFLINRFVECIIIYLFQNKILTPQKLIFILFFINQIILLILTFRGIFKIQISSKYLFYFWFHFNYFWFYFTYDFTFFSLLTWLREP